MIINGGGGGGCDDDDDDDFVVQKHLIYANGLGLSFFKCFFFLSNICNYYFNLYRDKKSH